MSADEALPVLMTLLDDHNLYEYLLLKLDCNPRRFEGACDFALYLIVPEFDSEEGQRAHQWLANTEWKGNLEGGQEAWRAAIHIALRWLRLRGWSAAYADIGISGTRLQAGT
jgi:hypothetical protein